MSWWKRNRIWLFLLVPLVMVAVAASSFRLVKLYLPWQWSRPVVAMDSIGELDQKYRDIDGVKRHRSVQVEVLAVKSFNTVGEVAPVEGTVLWKVTLQFTANPDQFLYGCDVQLIDRDQNHYGYSANLEAAEPDGFYLPPALLSCVPEDAPGPTVQPFTDEVIESPVPRPSTWSQDVLIAIPEGVSPTRVQIGWTMPEYLLLEVPEG